MKKIHFLIIGLIAVSLFSCDPNKQIYEELDASRTPYNEQFTYELTAADYATISDLALAEATTAEDSAIANDVADLLSFSANRQAALLVPAFLEASFIALDSSSAVVINYTFSYEHIFASDPILFDDTVDATGYAPGYASEIVATDPVEGDLALVEYTWAHYGTDTTYEPRYNLYVYNGTAWSKPSNAFEIAYEDYNAMGISGNYMNFSSSTEPSRMLPVFFKTKFPYAQAGDEYQVVYKYYGSGSTTFRYNKYFFDGSEWYTNEANQDQFLHTGEKWVFDPTVAYYLQKDDYQFLVDWIASNDLLVGYLDVSYPDNTEQYFGASAYYGNFDMRQTTRTGNDPNGYLTGLSVEEIDAILFERTKEAVELILPYKYPNAQPFSNGVPVYYEISFDAYNGKHVDYMFKYLCTEVGVFEYVEGPTVVE